MKFLSKKLIIQIAGVLTLLLGNFLTAGQALAEAVKPGDVSINQAALVNEQEQLISQTKVGEKAKLTFNLTVGSRSKNGRVSFNYDDQLLKIKPKRYRYANGATRVVVTIGADESEIRWRGANGRVTVPVSLPTTFRRPADQLALKLTVAGQKIQLPTINVLEKSADLKQGKTATAGDLKSANQFETMQQQEQAAAAQKASQQQQQQAYLAKKQAADQKQAAENQQRAIAESKKQQRSVDNQQSAKAPKTTADSAKSQSSSSASTLKESVTDSRKAIEKTTDDDDEAEPPAGPTAGVQESSKSQSAVKRVFTRSDESEGTRSINELVKSYFFDKISYTIHQGGNSSTYNLPTGENSGNVQIPETIRGSDSVDLHWEWSTGNIEDKNAFPADQRIQDGDYYEFDLVGFKYDYGQNERIKQPIVASQNNRRVGYFIMTPTDDPGVQKIRIVFTPGELANTNVVYNTKLSTTFDESKEEIHFGQVAKDGSGVQVAKASINIQKDGSWGTQTVGGQEYNDYSKVKWTSVFNVKESMDHNQRGASKVVLFDQFEQRGGYDNSGKFEYDIEGIKDGKPVSSQAKLVPERDGTAKTARFTFNAADIFEDPEAVITKITLTHTASIWNLNNDLYENQIRVESCQIGNDTVQTDWAEASIKNTKDHLQKTMDILPGGIVQAKVRFAVDADDDVTKLVLTDEVLSRKFKYDNTSFKLFALGADGKYEQVDLDELSNWRIDDDGHSFKIEFKEEVKPQTGRQVYRLEYQLKPDGATNDDYNPLINHVRWKDKEYAEKKTYKTANEKTATGKWVSGTFDDDTDWDKMTTSWRIGVNLLDRDINFPVEIVDFDTNKSNTVNYLKYRQFFDNFKQADADKLKDYLDFQYLPTGSGTHRSIAYHYDAESGKYYWGNQDDPSKREAFEISYDNNEGKMTIQVKSNPNTAGEGERASRKFYVKLSQVPIDTEKLHQALESDKAPERLPNSASVKYDGEERQYYSASVPIPELIAQNISKRGQLDENFQDPDHRYINWEVAINYQNYLIPEILEEGIHIHDIFGPDKMINKSGTDSVSANLQDLSGFKESLKVSVANLSGDGSELVGDRQQLSPDDYKIEDLKIDTKPGDSLTDLTCRFILTESGKKIVEETGKHVFVFEYQTKANLNKQSDELSHLGKWVFHNQVKMTKGEGAAAKSLETKAEVGYADNGYLLHKYGELEKITPNNQELSGIKWTNLINGEGKTISGDHIKIVDELKNANHAHLNTDDPAYKPKLYYAKRTLDKETQTVGYEPDLDREFPADKYNVSYSDDLSTMTIDFKDDDGKFKIDAPLMLVYHTVINDGSAGSEYGNSITLHVGEKKFTDGDVIESNIESGASFKQFGVNIKKTNRNGVPLPGVTFNLETTTKQDPNDWQTVKGTDEQAITATTNEDGVASFAGLGTKDVYRVVEAEGNDDHYFTNFISETITFEKAEDYLYHVQAKNPYKGDLEIHKQVNSTDPSHANESFEFHLRARDNDGNYPKPNPLGPSGTDGQLPDFAYEIYEGDQQVTSGTVTFGDESNTLAKLPAIKDNQHIVIKGLPQNLLYQVEETNSTAFKTSHETNNLTAKINQENQAGKRTDLLQLQQGKGTNPGIITFTNRFDTEEKPAEFKFTKRLKDPSTESDRQKPFEFKLALYSSTNELMDYDGRIKGVKVTADGTTRMDVWFDFKDGQATHWATASDGAADQKITLADGESYEKIMLPNESRLKLFEKTDDQYSLVSYQLDDGNQVKPADQEGDFHAVGPIEATHQSVTVINEQRENQLAFSKSVMGQLGDLKAFNFEIEAANEKTLAAIKEKTFTASVVNATTSEPINAGKVTFDKNGQASRIKLGELNEEPLTLQDGQKLILSGLPTDATHFKVTEKINESDPQLNFEATYSVAGGEVQSGKVAEIELNTGKVPNLIAFTNTIEDYVPLIVKKTVSGGAPKDQKFEFDMTIAPSERLKASKVEFNGQLMTADQQATKVKLIFNRQNDGSYRLDDQKIRLSADEWLTVYVPTGTKVTISERVPDDYRVSHRYDGQTKDGSTAVLTTRKQACYHELVFNNHLPTTSLKLTKQLRDVTPSGKLLTAADFDLEFEFDLEVTDNRDNHVTGQFEIRHYDANNRLKTGKISFKDGQLVNVKLGESTTNKLILKGAEHVVILGLPDKATVTATEKTRQDFSASYQVGGKEERPGNVATSQLHETDSATNELRFINTKLATNLKLSKQVVDKAGKPVTHQQTFAFQISAAPVLNQSYRAIKQTADGQQHLVTVDFENGQSIVHLKSQESLTMIGLPSQSRYQISEELVTGFRPSYRLDETADEIAGLATPKFQLTTNQQRVVRFTNQLDEVPATGSLIVHKFVNQLGDRSRSFNFELQLTDGLGQPINQNLSAVKWQAGKRQPINLQFANGSTNLELAHGDSIRLNLPLGSIYRIKEQLAGLEDYTVTATRNGKQADTEIVTGQIDLDGEQVAYHNDRQIALADQAISPEEGVESTLKPDTGSLVTPDKSVGGTAATGTDSRYAPTGQTHFQRYPIVDYPLTSTPVSAGGSSGLPASMPGSLPSNGYTPKGMLPQTDEKTDWWLTMIGLGLLLILMGGGYYRYRQRKSKRTDRS